MRTKLSDRTIEYLDQCGLVPFVKFPCGCKGIVLGRCSTKVLPDGKRVELDTEIITYLCLDACDQDGYEMYSTCDYGCTFMVRKCEVPLNWETVSTSTEEDKELILMMQNIANDANCWQRLRCALHPMLAETKP